jgi:D-inositol-3-phosphate glycosyltransferase
VSVVPEGVNLGQFHPDEEAAGRARRTWDLTGPIVLYVGRVCEQKGTNILLDAWEQHLSRKGTLVLAGPIGHFGNDREDSDLAARISRMDVRHLGAVPEGKLAGLYNACDVFVMPTTRAEMFGMAALEAQACGKPVVASRCGGLPDTIAPDGGILFEPGHSDELAGAIDLLLRDAPTRTCMGAAAARHAEAFSWTTIGERLDVIYHAICKSR